MIDNEQNITDSENKESSYEPEFRILYEDNHIIVVLKPQMVPCCPDITGDNNLLDMVKNYIKIKYNKPGNVYVGLIHRLDRPTGGVMVFAKTSKAAARLSESLRAGEFEKKYLTVLCGTIETERGTLTNYLKKNTVNNLMFICTPSEDGAKFASLDYKVLDTVNKYSLTEIRLHTGRSHQIRVQTAGIGHPVFGDMRYGGPTARKGKLALWAYSLSFIHPTTKEKMLFIAYPPEDEIPWSAFDLAKSAGIK